jgi:hypothetical protein
MNNNLLKRKDEKYFGKCKLAKIRTTQSTPSKLEVNFTPKLAMSAPVEHICTDAQPFLDPEAIERFCRVWAEVGRAILARRSKSSE